MALKMNSFRWVMVFLIVAFAGFWNPVQAGGVQKKLKLCMQSCTFHRFSLQEAFEKTHELGVKYIEIFPGHRIGGKYGDQLFDYRLGEDSHDVIWGTGILNVGHG